MICAVPTCTRPTNRLRPGVPVGSTLCRSHEAHVLSTATYRERREVVEELSKR